MPTKSLSCNLALCIDWIVFSFVTVIGRAIKVECAALLSRACLILGALSITASACGAVSMGTSANHGACVFHARKGLSRIKPENSNLKCSEIRPLLVLLPNEIGTWPLKGSDKAHDETCRIYPRSTLPLEIRCYNGHRHFEVVKVDAAGKEIG